jgi:hypothetical protein
MGFRQVKLNRWLCLPQKLMEVNVFSGQAAALRSVLRGTTFRAETKMVERRQAARSKAANGALIFSNGKPGVRACAIRDISDTGVGLRLHGRDAVTSTFKITFDNFISLRTCQLVWSRSEYIGAVFRQDPDPTDRGSRVLPWGRLRHSGQSL